jgi:hypothetical protein
MGEDHLLTLYVEMKREIASVAGFADEAAPSAWKPQTLNPIQRRVCVRSVYALIEAVTYQMKQDALKAGGGTMSDAERAFCAEEAYELDSNGEVRVRSARLRPLDNLRFAFDISASVHGAEFTLDLSGSGWSSLTNGFRIRNRLAHPKQPADLVVSDKEITTIFAGLEWIEESVLGLAKAQAAALFRRAEEIKRHLARRENVDSRPE